MGIFAISYDLIRGGDYQTLWDQFDRLGAHKALESFYLANLRIEDPDEVKALLRPFLDQNDMLMVVKVVGRPSFVRAKAGTNDWIARNCP